MADTVVINDKFALDFKSAPMFQTAVQPLSGGYEDRNQDWEVARWRYDVEFRNRPLSEMQAFLAHILGRRGRANAFPLRDPLDNTLTDELIGTGDGVTAAYQIRRLYDDDDRPYYRLYSIVTGLVVKVAGITKTAGVHYNQANGIVTFTGGNIPAGGQAVTVSCGVLILVRYDADYIPISLPVAVNSTRPLASATFTLVEVPR
ncbi:DUF2460 domain-containing protein [Mesorhizobium sp.]|uniref:DUF2460 domain-containing protein n=1 Tax=Mesorhizobium sp. TaxID=1871066 RepID=UPI001222C17C|nr:DUF2460 domain-containing protein [Mesorhizobium sp.]TIO62938.1 MAG: hypothetical protein E5X79_01325 [Mesorhizobium sp.]